MLMSRVVLLGVFFVGSVGLSNAAPLDTPDTVYIDGTPCNSVCQSYMAWSRQILSGRRPQTPPDVAEQRAARTVPARQRPIAHDRAAKQAAPAAGQTGQHRIARLHQPGTSAIPAPIKKTADADSRATPTAAAPSSATPSAVEKPVEQTAGLQQPTVAVPPNRTDNAASPAEPPGNTGDAGSKTGSKTRALQDQLIAATALAEQLTSTTTARPELRAMNSESHTDGAAIPSDGNMAASPVMPDALVAVVMSRPEIKSVADLAGKNVAIDGKRSGSANNIRIALVAAGAGEVQVSTGDAKAIDRLVDGEVPAAVLTLVSSDAAKTFPEIAGYKVFRIPLSPGSVKQDGPR
jgi:hypothetical protein